MKVSEKGQVTIPKPLRDALGIGAGTQVEFAASADGHAIEIRKVPGADTRGRRVADRLRGRGDIDMTTDEIMSLTRAIDEHSR